MINEIPNEENLLNNLGKISYTLDKAYLTHQLLSIAIILKKEQ